VDDDPALEWGAAPATEASDPPTAPHRAGDFLFGLERGWTDAVSAFKLAVDLELQEVGVNDEAIAYLVSRIVARALREG